MASNCATRTSQVAEKVPASSVVADPQPCLQEKEFDFVERPSQDFFCPVSLELLLEPQQTSCCGNHLSLEVASRLQKEGKQCPVCNGEQWSVVLDKYHRRRVQDVRVRCWYKKSGCGWAGEVRELKRHADSCEKRPWKCEYCALECRYGEGEGNHWPECTKYPEPCPNVCEVGSVERCGMEEHLKVCPLEPVACEMKEFGCEVVVPRKDLADHMRDSGIQHLTAMTLLNLRLTKQLQQESVKRDENIQQLQQAMTAQLQQESAKRDQMQRNSDKRVEMLQDEVKGLKDELKGLKEELAIVKDSTKHIEEQTCSGHEIIEFSDYSKLRDKVKNEDTSQNTYSHRFYPHKLDYAFQLMVRFYRPTHNDIGVFLSLVEGENDDLLKWPAKFNVTVELLNQTGDHTHFGNISQVMEWTKSERGQEKNINDSLIKYVDLEKERENVQYIVNDTLKFRIIITQIHI